MSRPVGSKNKPKPKQRGGWRPGSGRKPSQPVIPIPAPPVPRLDPSMTRVDKLANKRDSLRWWTVNGLSESLDLLSRCRQVGDRAGEFRCLELIRNSGVGTPSQEAPPEPVDVGEVIRGIGEAVRASRQERAEASFLPPALRPERAVAPDEVDPLPTHLANSLGLQIASAHAPPAQETDARDRSDDRSDDRRADTRRGVPEPTPPPPRNGAVWVPPSQRVVNTTPPLDEIDRTSAGQRLFKLDDDAMMNGSYEQPELTFQEGQALRADCWDNFYRAQAQADADAEAAKK